MKRSYWPLLATLLATLFFAAPASAQDISLVSCESGACCDSGVCDGGLGCCDSCDGVGCDSCSSCDSCGGGGGFLSGGSIFAEAEVLFFKYDRADGTAVGRDHLERVMGDHETAYRLSLGFITDDGLGYRMRYFKFDQANASGNGGIESLGTDAWTLDFEVFERFCLNENWTVELAGGVRYSEFDEEMIDSFAPFGPRGNQRFAEYRANSFDGWGGILGLQANRRVGSSGSVYGRIRGAIMTNDKTVTNSLFIPGTVDYYDHENLVATTQGMMELSVGYEFNRCLSNGSVFFGRIGYEWQTWYNYSSSFAGPVDTPVLSLGESIFTGPADVGFHGATVSIGIER